jgi:hypothetical protein
LNQTLDELRIEADNDPVEAVVKLKTASRNLPLVRSETEVPYDVVRKCLYWSETADVEIDSLDFQEAMFHAVIEPLLADLRQFDGR